KSGASRGRAEDAGRGAGRGGPNAGARVRGGAVSAQGGTDAAAAKPRGRGRGRPGRSRSLLPEGDRDRSPTERPIAGAARGDGLKPAVATTGQAGRRPPDVGRDLRLVHRRLRHLGPTGGQGAALRAPLKYASWQRQCMTDLFEAGVLGCWRPGAPSSLGRAWLAVLVMWAAHTFASR